MLVFKDFRADTNAKKFFQKIFAVFIFFVKALTNDCLYRIIGIKVTKRNDKKR